MARDWIHRQNGAFASQAKVFSEQINSEPAAFGVSPSEAALLAADFVEFHATYSAAAAPETRTRGAVSKRNAARQRLAARMRELGARIRANSSISAEAKIGLSLHVPRRSAEGASVAPPMDRPRVVIRSVVGNLVRVRLTAGPESNRSTRPAHVAGAELFFHAGPTASADLGGWRPAGITMSSRATIRLPFIPPGTKLWITARWFDGRGRTSPIALPAHAYVGEMLIVPSLAA